MGDVLRTNINTNSSSTNPNDRLLCFEVLQNLENQFIIAGVVEKPVSKQDGNPNHVVYQRVSFRDWNKFAQYAGFLRYKNLEAWARTIVDESIANIRMGKTNKK